MDLIVSIEKLEAIKEKLTVRVQGLAAHNKQLQQKPETTTVHTQCDGRITKLNNNSAEVSTAVHNRQKAELSQFRKQRDAEKVKEYNTKAFRSAIKEMMHDTEAKASDQATSAPESAATIKAATESEATTEAQAMEARFDGANGEAAPSADFLDELEHLWLEDLATAESQIEGLQGLGFETWQNRRS